MLEIAAAAPLFLSQTNQPHALLPFGNAVPLHSEAFYSWLSLALSEKGYTPAAGQISFLLRQLDTQAHARLFTEPVHLRTAKSAHNEYRVEFHTAALESIEITPQTWKIAADFDTRFYRPETALPFLRPEPIKQSLPTCLSQLLQIDMEQSRKLSTWLAHALLATPALPALILTGKHRLQAAEKLRTILDPSLSPILELPRTTRDLGRAALTNSVMIFSIYTHLPKGKIEMFNQLRHGLPVRLREVNKHRPPITTTVHRPIIVTAEKAPKIHEDQLTIEVNETRTAVAPQLFAALLNAAVTALAAGQPEPQFIEFELAANGSIPPTAADFDTPGP